MKKLILILTMGLSLAAVAEQSEEDARKPNSTSNQHYQYPDSKKDADRDSNYNSARDAREFSSQRADHSGLDPRY